MIVFTIYEMHCVNSIGFISLYSQFSIISLILELNSYN